MLNPLAKNRLPLIAWTMFLVGGLGFECVSHAQLPTAELLSLSRQVIHVGESCDLTLQGNRLDEPSQMLMDNLSGARINITATPRLMKSQPLRDDQLTTTTFDLKFADSVPPGLIEVRSVGRFGVSNPRSLLISKLPVDLPSAGIENLATAHVVKPNWIINDTATEKASNYYRCLVPAGQRLRFAAYSKQLDSLAELNLRLLNEDGQLIASSRAVQTWPAELTWSNAAEQDETVFIEVRDLLYRGGANFGFALEVQLDSATPNTTEAPLHLDTLIRPILELPLSLQRLSQPSGAVYLGRGWNDAVELPTTPLDHFPVRLRGDLLEPRIIKFNAQKDQSLSFEIASASLDQLTDPAIIIYKVNSTKPDSPVERQQVAEQDDVAYLGTPAVRIRRLDPHLVWKAPESASYELHVVDRQTGQRPNDSRGFLIEIRPTQPQFALIAHVPYPTNNLATSKPWGSIITRNGTTQLSVTVLRYDGFAGPIELNVEGLPANCSCPTVIVPAGATDADVIVQAASDIDNSLANLSIVGTAKLGDDTLRVRAAFATISSAVLPTRNSVASRSTGIIATGLTSVDTAPLQLKFGDDKPLEVKAGTKVNIPVKLVRQSGSAAECTLRPKALPPKVALGELKIAGDKSEASPEVNVPADAPVGDYTFWVQAETKVKWRANPQDLTREEAYAAKLKTALESSSFGDIPRPQIEEALKQANARVEELKKSTAEQEYTLFLPSNTVRMRILPKE